MRITPNIAALIAVSNAAQFQLRGLDRAVKALFTGSAVGAWYDYSAASSLFDDSTVQIPATIGGHVGAVLDLGIGTYTDISTTGWTKTAGDGVVTVNDNVITITGATTSTSVSLNTPVWGLGDLGEITLNSSIGSAVSPFVYIGGSGLLISSGLVTYDRIVVASTLARIQIASGSASFTVTSRRLISGPHLMQITTGSQPIWQTTYAELDAFDDYMTAAAGGAGTTGFLFAAAIRPSGTGTARTIWSDAGTNTGYKVTLDTSDRLVLSAGNGVAYTSAVRTGALVDGTDYVVMVWHDGTNLNVSVNNGAATQQAFATATAGTAGFTIGRDNGAATGPFGARIYSAVYRKNDASTAAERTAVASYLAGKGGVTL